MRDIDRETVLAERMSKAEAAQYKYETHRKKLLEKQATQKVTPAPQQTGRKRLAQQPLDGSHDYSLDDDDDMQSGDNFSHDDSYDGRRKRRLQKTYTKQQQIKKVNVDSDSHSDDEKPQHHKSLQQNYASQKQVTLQEFTKVVVKRKDLAKWIEVDQYREGLKGAFVRVIYNTQYVIG